MMLPESMAQLRSRQLRSRQLHHVDPLFPGTASSHSSQFVPISHRFEQQVRETPEHPAVLADGRCLTYSALNLQANQLAHHLRRLGVMPGMGVGVCLAQLASPNAEGSPQFLVTLLAILKAGAAFIPLDPTDTPERIALIMEDAGLEIVVTQEIFWDRLPASEAKLVLLDLDAAAIQRLSGENLQGGVAGEVGAGGVTDGDAVILPQDLACQLYASDTTVYASDTTGRPKGLPITHGAVAHLLQSMAQEPDMAAGEASELGAVNPLLVTMTVRDRALLALFLPLFLSLTLGETVVLASEASAHSVTGAQLPEADEAERMQHTVDRILALQPQRLLEVGCGSGGLLFQVAPHCDRYWAIDPNAASLAHLSQHLQQNPSAWSHVAIAQGQADAIATLLTQLAAEQPSGSHLLQLGIPQFDTIVLNDVVQSFPNVDYLVAVIEQLMTYLEPGGRLFIGDVRHLGLRQAFHTAVQLHQSGADDAITDESSQVHLRQQVQSHWVQAQELSLDPDFFRALVRRLEEVAGVTLQLKRGQHRHVLNDCCYDVVLHRAVAESVSRPNPWGLEQGCPMQWLGSTLQQQLLADVERCDLLHVAHYLHAVQPETLGFRNLPNPRLWDIARTCEPLNGAEQCEKPAIAPIEPEQWWALSRTLPYQVHLSWAASGRWDCYDVRLHRTDADPMAWANLSLMEAPLRDSQPWAAYANAPRVNGPSSESPSTDGFEAVTLGVVEQMLADAQLDPEILPAIASSPEPSAPRQILPWEQHRHRIRALCGDLSQPNLGLTPACFQQLAQRDAASASFHGQTFHIANPHPLAFETLATALRRFDYPLWQLPYQDWRQAVKSCDQPDHNALSPLLNHALPEASTGLSALGLPHISQQWALSPREALPLRCSNRIHATLIHCYIRDLIRHHGLAILDHPSDAQAELHSTVVR